MAAPPEPAFREAGTGPGVVCLHANASSSSQWRGLMDRLAPRFHVLAADGYGAGRSPRWPADRSLRLDDEVALLAPVLARAGDRPVLVGHSYGAAVALVAALRQPQRFSHLVLYEPTLFAWLDAESPPPNAADGIREAVARAVAALAAGDADTAAAHFIDYWMGAGSWTQMPAARRAPIAAAIVHVQAWATALFGESTPLAMCAALHCPVLLLTGSTSPASSRGVARLLAATLPKAQCIEFEGLGHMGPVTHPEPVNAAIEAFLAHV